MSKVLLAVSGNWQADMRIDAIANLARRLGSSILVVHVIFGTDRTPAEVSPGERALEQVAARLRGNEIKVETLLLFSDDVADAMLKTAEEHKVTWILLGLSTKGMLQRLIEGNIPQEIIKATHLPVLMLPPDWSGAL